jgi:hypothetical protein
MAITQSESRQVLRWLTQVHAILDEMPTLERIQFLNLCLSVEQHFHEWVVKHS